MTQPCLKGFLLRPEREPDIWQVFWCILFSFIMKMEWHFCQQAKVNWAIWKREFSSHESQTKTNFFLLLHHDKWTEAEY